MPSPSSLAPREGGEVGHVPVGVRSPRMLPRPAGRRAATRRGLRRRSRNRRGRWPDRARRGATAAVRREPAPSPRSPPWSDRASRRVPRPPRPPESDASNTGRQSAVRMAQTRPGRLVNDASARPASPRIEIEHTRTVLLRQPHRLGRHPRGDTQRRRFSATASALSPTWAPRLSDSKGAALTPPRRRVESARTSEGAGQSGQTPERHLKPSPNAAMHCRARPSAEHAADQQSQRAAALRTRVDRRSPDDRRRELRHAVLAA